MFLGQKKKNQNWMVLLCVVMSAGAYAMARVMEKRAGRRRPKQWFELHRPSNKGTKLLLKVIKAIIIISGMPLPGTGWHMMPWPACAFVRAAHGHTKRI